MSELFLTIKCPHCQGYVIIKKNEINCRIFRHGVVIKTKKTNTTTCK